MVNSYGKSLENNPALKWLVDAWIVFKLLEDWVVSISVVEEVPDEILIAIKLHANGLESIWLVEEGVSCSLSVFLTWRGLVLLSHWSLNIYILDLLAQKRRWTRYDTPFFAYVTPRFSKTN